MNEEKGTPIDITELMLLASVLRGNRDIERPAR